MSRGALHAALLGSAAQSGAVRCVVAGWRAGSLLPPLRHRGQAQRRTDDPTCSGEKGSTAGCHRTVNSSSRVLPHRPLYAVCDGVARVERPRNMFQVYLRSPEDVEPDFPRSLTTINHDRVTATYLTKYTNDMINHICAASHNRTTGRNKNPPL